MSDPPPTPARTVARARGIARAEGLRHVYTGNVHDPEGSRTLCTGCGEAVVERDGYDLVGWRLDPGGRCEGCGTALAGVFEGSPGRWGSRRRPGRLRDWQGGTREDTA